jgi:crotonobetainyl-CoA:carnitine CoA-transferase CaiB-like acyl-CoA transferase
MAMLPLSGYRVIDASSVLMGPYASQWLGDLGAEVIKVEAPAGDSTRQTGPSTEAGMGAVFMGTNRNKRSVVIDLKQAAGQAALHALLSQADVFMHSIRPQKLAAIGLDPTQVRQRHPQLVFATLHGFTETGPYGGRPAYDDIIQGMSGIADLSRLQGHAPQYLPTASADKTSGLVAALSIMAAMLAREKDGQGRQVEVPMFESMVSFNLIEHLYGLHFDPALAPPGYPRVTNPWRRPYQTRDGHVCMMPYTDAHWQRFFRACGRDDWADDPRFASMAERTRHIGDLYEALGTLVIEHPTDHWLDLCARIDIPAARVNALTDLPQDPHLEATGFFQRLQDPAMGSVQLTGVPVLFDGQRPPVSMPPRLGEHTRSSLLAAGVSHSQIDDWIASGAIVQHPDHCA